MFRFICVNHKDGNEGSGTDDDFEENEFDSDVFTYGGAAVSVQEVELWDDAGVYTCVHTLAIRWIL